MKYIDTERLKTFVQARRDMHYNHYVKTGVGCIAEYKYDEDVELLDLITSLQKEQEQPEVDLEKEIDACWRNWLSPSNQKEVEGVLPKTEFAMYARHFYELGLKARKV